MLGYPIEYFVPDVVRAMSLTFSDLFSSYEDLICCGFKSRNGVFGLELEGEQLFSERALLSDLRNWRLIYLTRHNILAQAISNAFAIRSGTWHSFVSCEKLSKPLLERFFIVSRINELLRQERAFEKVFCHERVQPYRLTYEDLIAAPARQASLIADHIGVAGVDFSAFDIKEATIQPTQRGINRYYELLTIMSSGAFWGIRSSRDPRQACGDARWRERRSLAVGHRTATGRVPG